MNPHFWPNIPKANFLRDRAIVNSGISEGYETDLDFWPKNPKAKTNPILPDAQNERKLLFYNEL